nr:signal recognition particle subunit SRP19/SEC65 family protein [Methanothermus fervidus]
MPKKDAVKDPTIKEMYEAAKKLGLEPEIEKNKYYPRSWWERKGRLRIKKTKSKIEIMKKISRLIKAMR